MKTKNLGERNHGRRRRKNFIISFVAVVAIVFSWNFNSAKYKSKIKDFKHDDDDDDDDGNEEDEEGENIAIYIIYT